MAVSNIRAPVPRIIHYFNSIVAFHPLLTRSNVKTQLLSFDRRGAFNDNTPLILFLMEGERFHERYPKLSGFNLEAF